MTTSGRRWSRRLAVALAVTGAALASAGPSGADPAVGQAGTDTALPDTDSAMTLEGRGPFDDLEVTVNQTSNLTNQAISVTWSGGEPTVRAGGADFAEHFLQVMQCWSKPGADGPEPENCQFGATDGVYGGRNTGLFGNGGFADDRVISRGDFASYRRGQGVLDEETNWQWLPFESVTGDTIDIQTDPKIQSAAEAGEYWLNPFFSINTTNEIVGGKTRADGTGEELVELHTGQESNGLGCGQTVLRGGVIPDCWLVVVPRGAAVDENADTIDERTWEGNPAVMTSPLAPAAWAHRIEFPLEFNPVSSPCDISAEQRRIVGTELVLRAIRSWQPTLCQTPGLPPFAYTPVPDSSARLQVVNRSVGAPGMAITPRPVAPTVVSPDNPVVYAPIALSGMVIGFNVERIPDSVAAPPEAEELRGVRIAELNLTPRLVAKLLTQSYRTQVEVANADPAAQEDEDEAEQYEWVADNPTQLDHDPDFLQFNEEFEFLEISGGKNFGGLVLSITTSDSARLIWDWIFADSEAAEWLSGEPDEFGMVVNPAYATDPDANRSGVPFGDPIPESFPKSEPFCFQGDPVGAGGRVVPPPLCGTDWLPYANSFREAAQRTRAANDTAKANANSEAVSSDRYWRSDGPQPLGTRATLSLTDSASAVQYGLQMANLSRAGDNGDDRAFIAPDDDGLLAGYEAMVPSDVPAVVTTDPEADAPDAYPLTMLSYALVTPHPIDERARNDYASFIEYAVGDGQEAGFELGELPLGYIELPDELREQARAAAALVRQGGPPVPTTTTVAPATTATTAAPPTTQAPPRSTTTAAPAAVAPSTTTTSRPVASTTTTEAPELGMTPASAVGPLRWALPFLGALALLSLLGALEITKRPRAGRPALDRVPATNAVVVVLTASALAVGLAFTTKPASAQEIVGGDLGIVSPDGDAIDGGGSAVEFDVRLSGAAECPGDSANDDFRVYSYMVPAAVASEDIVWDGLGASPRTSESYDVFRMPLFDTFTNEYAPGPTSDREAPGEPGVITSIPTFSFGVYRQSEMPLGDYRIGIACTRLNELYRYWDTEISITAAEDDPNGFEWQVVGANAAAEEDGGGAPLVPIVVALVVVGLVVVLVALRRRSPGAPTSEPPAPLETR